MEKSNKILYLSITSSILVILLKFFQWIIVDKLTVFILLPISFCVYAFFIGITVATVINWLKNKFRKPLAVQVITILLLFFFPFNQIILNIDFKSNMYERQEVVAMVKNHTLKPNISYNPSLIHLPEKYTHLSKGGGDIIVEKYEEEYNVFFFTFRGILDNYSGFVYTSNDVIFFEEDIKQTKKFDESWYFIGSY
ncbi:hypothetical protein GC105_14945 [Alkalibaculum sp. M08DMB]|uniref:Uncharacterized protein n=1 Tax=Alkalibaculum sporogenes TaxID=2655001 RepID=A0A6A7KD29_9FIRM|nr:hypothetical protein [Alkalibaculum sporogenes]MPW27077.1 hypothetical protein [Alkalibaculum sporogenes]